jgi:hypothetical protein
MFSPFIWNIYSATILLFVSTIPCEAQSSVLNLGFEKEIVRAYESGTFGNEKPIVNSNLDTQPCRQACIVNITGSGFLPSSGIKPALAFIWPISVDVDYKLTVIDNTKIQIEFLNSFILTSNDPLYVVSINTKGTPLDWIHFDFRIQVAQFLDLGVFSSNQKVYQSALNQSIVITGAGFKQGMSLSIQSDFILTENKDYTMVVDKPTQVG